MAPAAGIANRAATGFTGLNADGPGWLYYGVNAADDEAEKEDEGEGKS